MSCKPVGNQLERRHTPANDAFLIEEVVLLNPAGYLPLFLCLGLDLPGDDPFQQRIDFVL